MLVIIINIMVNMSVSILLVFSSSILLYKIVVMLPFYFTILLFCRDTLHSESESEVVLSCPTLCNPMDGSLHQASLSMGFSWQEYWSGLPFLSPGNLPNPGIESRSPAL